MTYTSYAALAAAETEGVDYSRTAVTPSGATYAAISIHGGGIEPGSGEMAYQVAGGASPYMRYYQFAGLKSSGNSALHITSTLFDEPNAVALVAGSSRTISFHGYAGVDGLEETALGGLDTVLAERIRYALEGSGFRVTDAPNEIGGDNPANICNENARSAGVQLEMSNAQRKAFFPNGDLSRAMRDSGQRTAAFYRYAAAVQAAVIGYGMVAQNSVNVSRFTTMTAPSSNVDLRCTVATDKLAVGGSHFCHLLARYADTNNWYSVRAEFTTSQGVLLTVRKRVTGTEAAIGPTFTTPWAHATGRRFWLRLQTSGTTLRGKVWPDGQAEPAYWQIEVTDSDLSSTGSIGTRSILSTSNTNTLPVTASWGDWQIPSPQTMTVVRSANGIVKSLSSGEDVRLATTPVTAL